jgi:protein ImuB
MFGVVYGAEGSDLETLADVARQFSPRIAVGGGREVMLDLAGTARLFGTPRELAEAIRRTAADCGLRVRVAVARTQTAARLLVRHRAGVTIVEPGKEAAVLGPLPIGLLEGVAPRTLELDACLAALRRWGLRTLGELAALPSEALAARLGQDGVRLQRLARGDDLQPLVPSAPEERFEQALDLEWPIEGLEPLSFVLGRLMEPLCAHLDRRGRGAAVLHVRLHLVRTSAGPRPIHERTLELPTPIKDARTLRTLALVDLESHPPPAAIDRVEVAVDPAPARVTQYSLIARPLPAPEQISTLLARLGALVGKDRCGAPAAVDSWRPGAFAMQPFAPADHDTPTPRGTEGFCVSAPRGVVSTTNDEALSPVVALRRFRPPLAARVQVAGGVPVRVATGVPGMSGGRVIAWAGPWRTSGQWWRDETRTPDGADAAAEAWDRDEWDVTLADGTTCRVFRDRRADRWFVEGYID